MEDFGAFLHEQRTLRGVSLEDIADSTRIPLRHLEALEENRYDDLPAEVFIKGYLRSFAEAAGLDGAELLAAYDSAVGKTRQEDRAQQWASAAQKEKEEAFSKARLAGVALVAGIALLGWWAWTAINQKTVPPVKQAVSTPETSINKEVTVIPPEPELEKPGPATGPVPGTGPQTGLAPEPSEPGMGIALPLDETAAMEEDVTPGSEGLGENKIPDPEKGVIINDLKDQLVPTGQATRVADSLGVSLVIRASEKAWFRLVIDNVREREFTLQSGEKIVIHAEKEIQADIGNRRGSEFIVNGKSFSPPGNNNVIRKFIFNANSVE